MKKALLFAALLAGLSGCNTIAGFADDVSAGTRAIQRSL